jgi:hypothetical protein
MGKEIGNNADVLADMILNDIMIDTVQKLNEMEVETMIDRSKHDNSLVMNEILNVLDEYEDSADKIRHKYLQHDGLNTESKHEYENISVIPLVHDLPIHTNENEQKQLDDTIRSHLNAIKTENQYEQKYQYPKQEYQSQFAQSLSQNEQPIQKDIRVWNLIHDMNDEQIHNVPFEYEKKQETIVNPHIPGN